MLCSQTFAYIRPLYWSTILYPCGYFHQEKETAGTEKIVEKMAKKLVSIRQERSWKFPD